MLILGTKGFMFKTYKFVILGYLFFLGLFFYALLAWFESPPSVGGFSIIATIPIFVGINIGLSYFAIRIWKSKQLQKFAFLTLLVGLVALVFLGLQAPKNSPEFVDYKLTQYGYRTAKKFPLIWQENKFEFERVASEISAKIGNHSCDENTITDIYLVKLKQGFLGLPFHLHPYCSGRIIKFPVMTFHGFASVNSWEIIYVIDWKTGAKLEKTCGDGVSCKEIAPGWIEYVFVT